MRESLETPQHRLDCPSADNNISDYTSVDNTSGALMSVSRLVLILCWMFAILVFVGALFFPIIYPEESRKYKKELQELIIYSSAFDFIKNVGSLPKQPWKEKSAENAFAPSIAEKLGLIGTGRHSVFKGNEALKEHWFYLGNGLLMQKYYVTDHQFYQRSEQGKKEMYYPISDIDHDEAAGYCAGLGGRLPSYRELAWAYNYTDVNNVKSRFGKIAKSNLELNIYPNIALWTSDFRDGGMFSFMFGDDYGVFVPGTDQKVYRDNGYNDINLSLLCVRRLEN